MITELSIVCKDDQLGTLWSMRRYVDIPEPVCADADGIYRYWDHHEGSQTVIYTEIDPQRILMRGHTWVGIPPRVSWSPM